MNSSFPKMRRHTLYFLREARSVESVFLDTEIDMRGVQAVRERMKRNGVNVSVISILVFAIARVFAAMPQANIAVGGSIIARREQYESVHAKVTLDKTLSGTRSVFSAVIPDADKTDLHGIQSAIDKLKHAIPETAPEFEKLRRLQALPPWLGYFIYRTVVRSLRARQEVHGSFAVTSLGHRSIRGFYPISGNTFTFAVGRITDSVVVRNGAIEIAPLLRLCLAFDHRAVDGALASDVMESVKKTIEGINSDWDGKNLSAQTV